MSLSQASSAEQIKRELKQQVFLAIQGKYDTRQTSQLIEDMNSIAGAIADSATDEAKSWQDTLSGCELDTTSHIMECPTSISRQDASTINKLIDKGALKVIAGSLGVPQSLLGKSDKPTSTVDMSAPQEFVESVRNKPMAGRCAGTSADQKPHIFIGGRHDGDTRQLTVDSDFKPHKESIGLSVTHNSSSATTVIYWRHHLTVVTGGRSVTRWFYCNEKDISGWTEQRLLSTLDRINKLFINNMEDPMNNI